MGAIEKRAVALDRLATDIRIEVEAAEADFQSAVAHAIRAGELLTEAKGKVKHGGWLPWLEANFPGSIRSAQNYMRLAENAEDAQRVAHLGIKGALAELAEPKRLPASEANPQPGLEEDPGALIAQAAMQERLIHCKHLSREQWEAFTGKCGELYATELLCAYCYGCIRETHPDAAWRLLRTAREAVAQIAIGGTRYTRDWARDILNGQRPPEDFWASQRQPVTPDQLNGWLQEYDRARWAMGDWLNSIEDGALEDLLSVVRAGEEATR